LYAPRSEAEVLPLHSSHDLSQDELGDLLFETVLQPGDVLYMPRGTVHQAEALPDAHSLHITLSVNQRNSWSDFLLAALPQAVALASDEEVELRSTLPSNWLHFMVIATPSSLLKSLASIPACLCGFGHLYNFGSYFLQHSAPCYASCVGEHHGSVSLVTPI
jgi:Cupin superfamily protein